MAKTAIDFSKFQDKKVVVVWHEDESSEATETEGTALAANDSGVLLKPKGKMQPILIASGQIDDLRHAEETVRKLGRKTLKIVEYGQARSHLLERHAYTVAQVNEMSEQEAYDIHEGIDHLAADLGHVHGDKSETPRGEAVSDEE